MSWGPTRTCMTGGGDGMKTAKWLMKQAERTDQQTVYLLNLLQEHRLEIEARDSVLGESSKLISKLQTENESLKQQLVDLERSTPDAGGAGAKPSSRRTAALHYLPGGRDTPAGQERETSRRAISAGADAHNGLNGTYSTLQEAWARVRVPSQAAASPGKQSQPLHQQKQATYASCQPAAPAPQLRPCSPTLMSIELNTPAQATAAAAAAAAACTGRIDDLQGPGAGNLARAALPQPVQEERRPPPSSLPQPIPCPQPSHHREQPHVRSQEAGELLKQLEARCASLTSEVKSLRAQLQCQEQEMHRLQLKQPQSQRQQNEAAVQPDLQLQARSASLAAQEVQSLRSALEAAQQAAAASLDKYLTCKKDLDVLTHKFDSLMVQKLEAEEERDRLFSPALDMAVLRSAMPAVDAAMCDLEERLREMEELMESNRVEAEDAVRAHHEQRRRWAGKLEGLQAQLEAAEARLAEAEARLAAAGVLNGAGRSEGAAEGGLQVPDACCVAAKWRQAEREVSLGGWAAGPEVGGGCGIRRWAISGDGITPLGGGGVGCHPVLCGALSSA